MMAKLNYTVTESVRRLSQILVGFEIFEFPILCKVRNFFYRLLFDIGEKPIIGRQVRLYRVHGLSSGTIKIGRECLLANHVEIDYSGGVTLEDHVWISDGAMIHTHLHPLARGRPLRKTADIIFSPLYVEESVWIGARAMIMPSVRYIKKNSIIGAGSIVTKDVPENVVVAGNPARIIKEVEF